MNGKGSISKMNDLGKESVTWLEIDESAAGQRIDNFLIRHLKGVPKSHLYRILRSGEVRVNSGRVDATCRLALGDKIRIPPIRLAAKPAVDAHAQPVTPRLQQAVLYEDDALLVIDKPSGIAVHGGSGISRGVIEQLRLERPEAKFLELVHRLDKETSGVLLLAKKRSALTKLHTMMRNGEFEKRYFALVKGTWKDEKRAVKLKLYKYLTAEGERRVNVNEEGKAAHTIFYLRQSLPGYTLLEAELKTGRTHQIRVHLAHLGYPIAGDDKYGDFPLNKLLTKQGLKRMFLHAFAVGFLHPLTEEALYIEAPLPKDLTRFVNSLSKAAPV
jgi:23S rRNA pseudouridine955/2504/2580 synthase